MMVHLEFLVVGYVCAFLLAKLLEVFWDHVIGPWREKRFAKKLDQVGEVVLARLYQEHKTGYIDCTGSHTTSHSATYVYRKNDCNYSYDCRVVDGVAPREIELYSLPNRAACRPADFSARRWNFLHFGLLFAVLFTWGCMIATMITMFR